MNTVVERGRVVALDRQGVWVEALCQSACGSCSARAGCGKRLLDEASNLKKAHVLAVVPEAFGEQLVLDDTVDIAIEQSVVSRGAVMVYLMPLFLMIAFMLLLNALLDKPSDGLSAFAALLGLLLGFAWVAYRSRVGSAQYQPVVIAKH